MQNDGCALRLAGNSIDQFALQFAAGAGENQLGHAIASQRRNAPVSAALEAMRRVGVHEVALGHAAHRRRVEPCRLDEHVLRPLGDHGIEAAHHACQRHRLVPVGNDEVISREPAFDAVEGLEHFAFAGTAHDDGAAFQQVEIEDVRGMAKLV